MYGNKKLGDLMSAALACFTPVVSCLVNNDNTRTEMRPPPTSMWPKRLKQTKSYVVPLARTLSCIHEYMYQLLCAIDTPFGLRYETINGSWSCCHWSLDLVARMAG